MSAPNQVLEDGVPVRLIGGRRLVLYSDAAEYRGCSTQTLQNDVWAGKLKSYQLGRFKAVDKDALDALILGEAL